MCSADDCALPMVVGRGSWSDVLRRFCGSRFMGLSSWVWVCGSGSIGLHFVEQVLQGWQLRLQAPRVSERRLARFARDISIYLQIMDPRGTSSLKWDCFASYCLAITNVHDDSKTIHHDSWHRFEVVGFGWG